MIKTYTIIPPAIPSGGVYLFTTDSGVEYEVRFGRKQNNILSASIVFGVLNDEFEGEEYVATNKGELYRVMNTIVEIVKKYIEVHPNVNSYEFMGEASKNDSEDDKKPTQRTKLYMRYLNHLFDTSWKVNTEGNKVTIFK